MAALERKMAAQVVVVPSARAEALRHEIHRMGLLDRSHRIVQRGEVVVIPVTEGPPMDLTAYGARLDEGEALEPRARSRDPHRLLCERLAVQGVDPSLAPRRWERIGDIVVLRLDPARQAWAKPIARAVGEVLNARTVVEDRSGIHGPLRVPDIRILWGDGTETTHVENGVRFRMDASRVMFSSGNLAERSSIAAHVRPGEVIVDLFAGIGYFSIPIAVHARPARIYACEINPAAYGYLVENVRINRVSSVVPLLGDCRVTAPRGVADRVLMGHFDAAHWLDTALAALRREGTIVIHQLCRRERWPSGPVEALTSAVEGYGAEVLDLRTRVTKSYAPGIVHAVVDARVSVPM